MCLIFLSFNQHPKYPLIIAANRDEFFDRPAERLNEWPDNKKIIAGKDVTGGGTWLGATTTGYFSMLTNFRDMANIKANAPTRGKLVLDYLVGEFDPSTYLQALNASGSQYNGYNIILGKMDDPWYYSNQENKIYQLGTGSYGLSNALLDTNWPKVEEGKKKFDQIIEQENLSLDHLFEFMHNAELAPDNNLPDTGIGYEKEKQLSSMYIEMPGYGTRNTTILLKDNNNKVQMVERTHNHSNNSFSDIRFDFSINN